MSFATALAVTALGAAIYLLSHPARIFATVAVIVAGLQVAMAQGWATFGIKGVSLVLSSAVVLAICGAILFAKTSSKLQVAAATLISFVGALQLLGALGVI